MQTGLPTFNTFLINDFCGETISLAVGTTSVSVTFASPASALNTDVLVTNAGTKVAFISFNVGNATAQVPGTGSPSAATINSIPILGGAIYNFQKNTGAIKADTCAAIRGGSDSTTLYFTSVQGS